jgi:replicative DNA helicase
MFIDESAEYRLLGSIIDKPETVLAYSDTLFTGDRARIFTSMRDAYQTYGDISYEGVARFYGRLLPPELEMSRGTKPAAVLEKLEDLATRRQLWNISEQINVVLAGNARVDRDELSKRLTLAPIISREDSHIDSGVSTFVADLIRKRDGKYKFARTGLKFLDHMLGGEWPRQAITVIIGQAGGGKTALISQSILNMARAGLPTLFCSLEMPKDRVIGRMVAQIAGVDGMKIRSGGINTEEQERIDSALEEIQDLSNLMFIVDRPGMTVEDIIYQVKLHREAHGIDAFFVDYLQIINRPKNENDVEELGHVTQQLRNTAVTLDVAAVALSQKNGQEGLQSIWGSRRIVHIADSIFEIEIDKNSTNDDQRLCRLNFLKNRDGAVGETNCLFIPKLIQFQ